MYGQTDSINYIFDTHDLYVNQGDLTYRWPDTRDIKCHICGKTIKEEVETDNIYLFDGSSWYGYNILPYDERACTITVDKQIKVCSTCQEQYQRPFLDEMNALWESLVADAIKDNANKRKTYEKKRIEDKLESIQKQINELKKQQEELLK